MAKRLRDTEMWKKLWFRLLPVKWKCFVDYLLAMCDCAGIWDVDFDAASFYIGEKISEDEIPEEIIKSLQITKFKENKWFVSEFIPFQYGVISEKSKMYPAIKKVLDNNKMDTEKILYRYCIDTDKDKDKDKDKVKRKEKKFIPPTFDEFAEYFKSHGYYNIAKKVFEYYDVAGWKDSQGDQVLNWKQKVIAVWFKPENKDKKPYVFRGE